MIVIVRYFLWITVSAIGVLASCGTGAGKVNQALPTRTPTPTPNIASHRDIPEGRLVHADGFTIPCLKKGKRVVPQQPVSITGIQSTISMVTYEPVSCSESAADIFGALVTGGEKYNRKVLKIFEYRADDAVFEYVVSVEIEHTGATNELTFVDSHRDGKFDTVFQSAGVLTPVLPEWIH